LSMPMAEDPAGAWKTFTDMLVKTLIIFIVFVNVVRTELRLKLLLLLILGISIYLSINAISDYSAGVFATGAAETFDLRIGGRIKGLFENSNDLALHLVSMIPITVALGLITRNPFKKLIYFGITALMVAGVTVTFSRGGFIGLIAATFVLVRRLGKKNRVATTGAVVFAVILFVGMAPGAFTSRVSTIFNSAADLTGSSSQRTEVLKRSIWVALRYPIFGVGIGNFHHKSPRNLETHNAYTQVSSEIGIPGAIFYAAGIIIAFRSLSRVINFRAPGTDNPGLDVIRQTAMHLQLAMVVMLAGAMFLSIAYGGPLYLLFGLAVALDRSATKELFANRTAQVPATKPQPRYALPARLPQRTRVAAKTAWPSRSI